MRAVTEDHGQRIQTIVDVLTLVNRRLDATDLKLATVETNDTEMKAKLGSLENQIVQNDAKLKHDLGQLEAQ